MKEFIYKYLYYNRKKAGMTQQEVADACEVNLSAYQKWEKGRSQPQDCNIRKLMRVFNKNYDYWFYDNEKEINAYYPRLFDSMNEIEYDFETFEYFKKHVDEFDIDVENKSIIKYLLANYATVIFLYGRIHDMFEYEKILDYLDTDEGKNILSDIDSHLPVEELRNGKLISPYLMDIMPTVGTTTDKYLDENFKPIAIEPLSFLYTLSAMYDSKTTDEEIAAMRERCINEKKKRHKVTLLDKYIRSALTLNLDEIRKTIKEMDVYYQFGIVVKLFAEYMVNKFDY